MGQFLKARTLVNPARKRRKKLTPKQIRFFGTKRQRAALKGRKTRNPRYRGKFAIDKRYAGANRKVRRAVKAGQDAKAAYYKKREAARASKHYYHPNPSRILTLSLPTSNPSRKRRKNSMAKSRKRRYSRRRRHVTANPVRRYRRRRATVTHRRRRRNPTTKVVYRSRSRRVHHRRRRNPSRIGGMGGTFNKVGGLLGGAAVTFFVDKMLPVTLTTGFIGYITTAVVAMLQGKVVGGVLKNRSLGNNMVTGGFIYLALKVVSDMFPSLGAYLPFSLKGGMGMLAPSSFFVPQVNQWGSMGSFVRPSGLPAMVAAPASLRGINTPYPIGINQRRTGRMS